MTVDTEVYLRSTETELAKLPDEWQAALRFAVAHNRVLVIGYVEDEQKVYLKTIPDEDGL